MFNFPMIDRWNSGCRHININHLIVLCEIKDEYASFCNDLEKLIHSKKDLDLVKECYDAMQGKIFFGANKYKSFIKKHKKTINIMNEYYCLSNLTVLSYDAKGKRRNDLDEDYFYQYIMQHKKDIEIIKAVALKLKDLGFESIYLDENVNFTESVYELNTTYENDFAFLENLEVIPTYLNNVFRYKTNSSCYCMYLSTSVYGLNPEISKYRKRIKLNSLIFNPNRLPDELTVDTTINKIKMLLKGKIEECKDIKDAVDLNVSISTLKCQFEYLQSLIKNNHKIKDKEQLLTVLLEMENILVQLQSYGKCFERQVIDLYPDITEQVMVNEMKPYLKRKYRSNIDK